MIANACEDGEGGEHTFSAGEIAYYENKCGGSSKNLEIDLPQDPVVPLLGTHAKDYILQGILDSHVHCYSFHNSPDAQQPVTR